jgi:hypothetical protein
MEMKIVNSNIIKQLDFIRRSMTKDPDQQHKEGVEEGKICLHPEMSEATKMAINNVNNNIKDMKDENIDIKNDIKDIKENHLAHVQKDMNDIKLTQTVMKTDLAWLKKFFWLVATASVGSLIASILNLALK